MKRFMSASLLCALLVLVSATASAKREHRYDSGPCKGGAITEWYCVTTFENGVPVSVQGRGCDGQLYEYNLCDPDRRVVGSDPVVGTSGVHTGRCDAGNDWNAEMLYNSDQQFAGVRGRSCTGEYYVIENVELLYPENNPQGGIE